ncbi:MAG: hypothetical protein ABSF85_19540 [Terriglobales bacterium]
MSLAMLATVCGTSFATDVPEGWRTYHNPDYGFVIAYPGSFNFYPVKPDLKEAQLSYIPICESESVACFEYVGNGDSETNFEAAGLSVNILREARTEEECNKIDTGQYPIKKAIINGVPFRFGETGGAATGHAIGGPAYRSFHERVCFELALLIAVTSSGYDTDAVKQFDSSKLEEELDKMLHTFRFVGPVIDGPGWKVYQDDGCGGVFEHPETAEVVTAIEYSNKRSASDETTCEVYFVDHSLKYTVAAKVNLYNPGQLDRWLRAAGYPDLSHAAVAVHSRYLTEYKAASYYYIYGENTLFILSVSDAQRKVVSPDNNPVFRHLLSSFKAN